MKSETAKLPSHAACPYCKTEHKIPAYAYAHWNDDFTVKCEKCGKSYAFFQGHTEEL